MNSDFKMQIYTKEQKRIRQNKDRLEKALNAKLIFSENGDVLNIEAKPEDEYIAAQVIEAINLGFKSADALLIKGSDFSFEKINVKSIARRGKSNINAIIGRILGKNGRVIETLSSLTGCIISLRGRTVGIIGREEDVENAAEAVRKLIRGSKHGNVFAFLEKQAAKQKQML